MSSLPPVLWGQHASIDPSSTACPPERNQLPARFASVALRCVRLEAAWHLWSHRRSVAVAVDRDLIVEVFGMWAASGDAGADAGGGGCTRLAGEAQDKTLLAVKMLEEMGFAGCGREALCEILLKAEARSFSHRSQQVTAGP